MSPKVVDTEIICTDSGVRWRFIRGIMMGFIRGITLEDHPLRPAKTQVTDPVGGSAGIPDSLAHKPEDTSGRAGWSAFAPPCLPHLCSVSHLFHTLLSSFYYLILLPSFRCASAPVVAVPMHGGRRAARSLTCANQRAGMAGILTVRTAFYSPTMTAARPREKSLVNGWRFVLRGARCRVIIELSPGEPETTPNTTPGASHVRLERGPS
jgi:hypothetical protein